MRSPVGLNGSKWVCEKTGPHGCPRHSSVRHGFAGGRLQYVSGFLSQSFVCVGPDEQVLEQQEWSRLCGAACRNSAARRWAADIRLHTAPGSKSLDLGGSRLARESAGWLTSDEAHHGRHSRLIYDEDDKHSFLARQLRGLLLFSVSIVAWVGAVALSVFGRPIRQWMMGEFGTSLLVRGFLTVILPLLAMILAMLVLALIYWLALQHSTTWRSILPGAAAATILWWAVNLLFGAYVRKMHYGPVYGGLAAVFGLMVWMEFSAMIVFLGAAWNAENRQICDQL